MPKFSIETLDEWVNNAELPVAVASAGALGATAISGGVAAPFAIGTNIAGAALDLYQGIRAGMKGDWLGVGENAVDLTLSLIGAKYMSKGAKLLKLDKALDAQGAPRQMVTKTVGRGPRKRYYKTTPEHDKAVDYLTIGGVLGMPSLLKEVGKKNNHLKWKYKNTSVTDNIRTIPARPLERISLQDTTINNNTKRTTNIKINRNNK